MRFDSLVKTEETINKTKLVTYYLTLDGKYFKLTLKTALSIMESFNITEGRTRTEPNGLKTTLYYQI